MYVQMHVVCRSSDLVVEDRFELFLGRHHQPLVAVGSVRVVVGSHHSSARRQHEIRPGLTIAALVRL